MQQEKGIQFSTQLKHFIVQTTRCLLKGPPIYYVWLLFLLTVIGFGLYAYSHQYREGLAITGMTDQVSWGLYISNFTYMVGVAAAARRLLVLRPRTDGLRGL